MGRPRKPLGVLKLAGTYRPDRHAAREHAPQPGGYPKMPDWLDALPQVQMLQLDKGEM